MLTYIFFSQKGANMRKQLSSRYNIGSMSVFFQERLRGTLLKLYVNIPTHDHFLQFQKSVRCITYAITIIIFKYNGTK
jgi:hypothetical protein